MSGLVKYDIKLDVRNGRGMSGMTKKPTAARKAAKYETNLVDRPAGERWISMSNALTRAGHGLTLAEKRIVAHAASKLDSSKALPAGEVPVTRLAAAEYAETFQVEAHTAYEALQSAAKSLYGRSVTFYEAAHRRRGKPIEHTKVQMRWVGSVKYHQGEGWVELHWWPKLLPHLTGLKRQFTSHQLKQASALRSVYSWRLLELLTRFEANGWAEYTVEDFAVAMDAPPSLTDFAQVKRRIIDPAVKELQAKDGWLIEWKPVKAGRKVKTLRFKFSRNPQGNLF